MQLERKPLILLADDNRVNRLLVISTLKDEPYRIVEVTNGREAIDAALHEVPDLILMDLMMPVVSGVHATRELKSRQETARVPILMLTALNATEDRVRAFDAGATGFLTKPFDRLELVATIRSYINLSRLNHRYSLTSENQVTGLPNRVGFRDRRNEFSRPWLYLLKIDGLSTISQLYGETEADTVERRIAARFGPIVQNTRLETAEVFHVARGVFGLVIDDGDGTMDRETAMTLGATLLQGFAQVEDASDDAAFDSDVTLAVVGSSTDGDLLDQAELALAEANRARISLVYAADVVPHARRTITNNLMWLRRIRAAVASDRIEPFFQPIHDNRSGCVAKYEALVRLIDTNGKLVPPKDFLAIAKTSRYYAEITRAVVEKSVALFADRTEGVSVNLSMLDIDNRATREFLFRTIDRYPAILNRLTLEIVEEEGLEHFEQVAEFVREVRQRGVTVAIDDFGSGYSNFARVIQLAVDYLKIDGSLIRDCDTDPVRRTTIEIIKWFADLSGIEVIAEFVGSESVASYLKALGIQYSQGFHYGVPIPAGELPTAGCSPADG